MEKPGKAQIISRQAICAVCRVPKPD